MTHAIEPPGPGEARPRSRLWSLPAAIFLLAGLATTADFGVTWDEPESWAAGLANLEIVKRTLQGRTDLEWPWHELTGYQFVFDTLRAGFGRAAERVLRLREPLAGFHLFNLLLSTAAVLLTSRIAFRVSGSLRVALLAGAALITTPKLLAHSQNNPKDVIALFLAPWTIGLLLEACASARARRFLAPGLAYGLALANHVASCFLFPLAGAWILWHGPGRLRDRFRALLVLLSGAGVAFLLSWPWLWPDPWDRLRQAARHVAGFTVEMPVLYLGAVYPHADPPAHYSVVSLGISLPLFHLAAFAAGLVPGRNASPGARRLRALAVLWSGMLLLGLDLTTARYDGARHLLPILPALALLAGLGLDRLLGALRVRHRGAGAGTWAARGGLVLLLAAYAGVGSQIARVHPYEDAYVNEAARMLLPEPREEHVELEYWGTTYKEGARWLRANAAPGSTVLVPLGYHVARLYLDDAFRVVDGDRRDEDDRPQHLMFLTRPTFYTPRIRELERERSPVFTIRRQGATLLRIYRLDAPRRGG